MTVLRIEDYTLRELPGRRLVEDDGAHVQVLMPDHDVPPGRTLADVAVYYARLLGFEVIEP